MLPYLLLSKFFLLFFLSLIFLDTLLFLIIKLSLINSSFFTICFLNSGSVLLSLDSFIHNLIIDIINSSDLLQLSKSAETSILVSFFLFYLLIFYFLLNQN